MEWKFSARRRESGLVSVIFEDEYRAIARRENLGAAALELAAQVARVRSSRDCVGHREAARLPQGKLRGRGRSRVPLHERDLILPRSHSPSCPVATRHPGPVHA
jgi:hypothetical protein